MRQIKIKLKDSSYNIYWSKHLSTISNPIQDIIKNRNVFILTNRTILLHYKEQLSTIFPTAHILPSLADSEEVKSLSIIDGLVQDLIVRKADRKSILIAFGGGVIGDITGFLASIYMRGIDFIQIPTTLLSMVDSSVGGKTGVNSSLGKNMIGTFWQPKAVVICTEFLKTLPNREIKCGLAEVIKSALLKDYTFFEYLSTYSPEILNLDLNIFEDISYKTIAIKKWVVEKDEKELWLRGILNLGHTLGHAIENYFRYKYIKHGEAVSIGLNFAIFYAFKKKYITQNEWLKVDSLLKKLSLPRYIQDVVINKKIPTPTELVELMQSDKKNQGGSVYYIFISKIGHYKLPEKVDSNEIIQYLEEYTTLC